MTGLLDAQPPVISSLRLARTMLPGSGLPGSLPTARELGV
jgi:hypothetical protein